jgi:YesN/AraC family two-component response regulator
MKGELSSDLITDYKMPLMSGIDLIKKIGEKDITFKLKSC